MRAAGAGGRHLGAAPDTAAAAGAILGPGRCRGGAGAAIFVWGAMAVPGGGGRDGGSSCRIVPLHGVDLLVCIPRDCSPAALGRPGGLSVSVGSAQAQKEARCKARQVLLLEAMEMPSYAKLSFRSESSHEMCPK